MSESKYPILTFYHGDNKPDPQKEMYFSRGGMSIKIKKSHVELRDGVKITVIDEFETVEVSIVP